MSELWTCPKCGAKLLTKNLWHSCGEATLADWKVRMGPRGRSLYDRFESMIAACGEYHVAPAKTRIAFLGKVRFAGITSLSARGMTCNFALPYAIDSPRFVKVDEVVPGWFAHRMRITEPAELDEQIQAWMKESCRLIGLRERLAEK